MNEAIIIWLYLSFGNVFNFELLVIAGFGLFIFVLSIPLIAIMIELDPEDMLPLLKKALSKFPTKTFILWLFLTAMYPTKDDLKYIIGGAMVWNGIEAA